jgi:hypothetical protein
MARSISEIQDEIKFNVRTHPELDKFLFPEDGGSNVSVFNLMISIVSLSMFTFEVLLDNFQEDVQTQSQEVPVGNPQWVRKQILLFQFGDIIILDENFIPFYPVVDPDLRIVTQCTVQEPFSSEIKIKVAKTVADVLTPLTAGEITALENYYFGSGDQQGIGFAGVRAEFLSQEPDRMSVTGIVDFLGQYVEANVKQDVIDAIDNYFANLNFDGVVVMNTLVSQVNAIVGVSNFVISATTAREFDVLLVNAVEVPVNGTYQTIAGYLISEDTVGATLVNTITMNQV